MDKRNENRQVVSKIADILGNIVKTMKPSGTILLAIKDKIIYEQFFGFADKEKKIPISFRTQYLIGSITKQFTAVALLNAIYTKNKNEGAQASELDEKIKGALYKPVKDYLPEGHEIWDDSMPEWANIVTIHQLLVHSSGIPCYTSLPNFEKQEFSISSQLINFFKKYPLEFIPGTKFSYSNSGYFLLGIIVQTITNQPLDVFLHDILFMPLGMNSTFFATQGTVPELKQSDPRFTNLTCGFTLDLSSSDPQVVEIKDYASMQMTGGAGGLISTSHDLLKWNNALFSGKIIPDILVELMLFPYIQTERENVYYGYGIEIKQAKNYKYFTHQGGIPGYRSLLTFVPELNTSIVILDNIFSNMDGLKSEMEGIRSSLPPTLSEIEKAQKIDEIIEEKFPIVAKNKKKFQLAALGDYIMSFL